MLGFQNLSTRVREVPDSLKCRLCAVETRTALVECCDVVTSSTNPLISALDFVICLVDVMTVTITVLSTISRYLPYSSAFSNLDDIDHPCHHAACTSAPNALVNVMQAVL